MENPMEHVWDVRLPLSATHSKYWAQLFDGECVV